jgi:glycosyltransferase involved in cell wall biosynthesis
MKITFVMSVAEENGGTRVVGYYAEKLLGLGHDVTVISRLPPAGSPLQRIKGRLRGHPRHSASRTRFLDPLGSRHIQLGYGGPLRPEDVPEADIIIATWWRTAFEVAIMPPEKGKKIYFVQHHEVFSHLPYDLSAGSYYLPLKKITIAQWLVDTMAELYSDTDVVLVPNGVDSSEFCAPKRERNTRPTLGLMYSTVGFKGTDVALETIKKVKKAIPDLRVVAFGTQTPKRNMPLPDDATFHRSPSAKDLVGIYASCDVWLSASRSEGFGLPVLEAMACRTPVVATRTGVAPDIIVPGKNGYLADVNDSAALAEGVQQVLSCNSVDWGAMSDAARKSAEAYSWETSTKRFEAALRAIAEQV